MKGGARQTPTGGDFNRGAARIHCYARLDACHYSEIQVNSRWRDIAAIHVVYIYIYISQSTLKLKTPWQTGTRSLYLRGRSTLARKRSSRSIYYRRANDFQSRSQLYSHQLFPINGFAPKPRENFRFAWRIQTAQKETSKDWIGKKFSLFDEILRIFSLFIK